MSRIDNLAHGTAFNNAYYFSHLGNDFDSKGENELARTCYERALQIDSTTHDAYDGIGKILFKENRVSEAAQMFRIAIKHNPTFFHPYKMQGYV